MAIIPLWYTWEVVYETLVIRDGDREKRNPFVVCASQGIRTQLLCHKLLHNGASYFPSSAGLPAKTQEMLDFGFKHGIPADAETIAIDEVNAAFARREKAM